MPVIPLCLAVTGGDFTGCTMRTNVVLKPCRRWFGVLRSLIRTAEGIAVNSIAPAMARTDLFDVLSPDVLERASGNVVILNEGRDVR